MLKRFTTLFVYLLVMLLPLQTMATAGMMSCVNPNSPYPPNSQNTRQIDEQHACHEHVTKKSPTQKSPHKTNCATLCASLCAITFLPNNLSLKLLQTSEHISSAVEQHYNPITLPSLERPPIAFS